MQNQRITNNLTKYPVCRGHLDLELQFDCEETVDNICIQIQNQSNNEIPSKAIAVLSKGVIYEIIEKTADSSAPENETNAIFGLTDVLRNELGLSYLSCYELMELLQEFHPAHLMGFADDTNVSPTALNVTDGTLTVDLNIQLGYSEKKQSVFDAINNIEERFHCQADIKTLVITN